MKPLDHLTSAFECLWEAKLYLMKARDLTDLETRTKISGVLDEVSASRDRLQGILIEWMEKSRASAHQRSE